MGSSSPDMPQPPALLKVIATTLAELAEGAEHFGVALCVDADVAARHLAELQQIDRLAQSSREMALVLAAADPAQAVADIRLGDLRQKLEQAHA